MSELTDSPPVPIPAPAPEKTPKTWKRRKSVVAMVGIGIACLAIGGASGTSRAAEAEDRADDAEAAMAVAEERADVAEAVVGDAEERADTAESDAQEGAQETLAEGQAGLDTRSAELDGRSAELDGRQAALDQRDADLVAREQAVGIAEADAEANSFGNGVFAVGTDIQPGRYHTDGGSGMCYYAFLGADGIDIIDNQIVDGGGPATVVIDSPFFESSDCGTWTKVG